MRKPEEQITGSNEVNQTPEEISIRIVSQPSEDDLVPTEKEKRLLKDLFDWQERSLETHWILEQPLGVRER